MATGTMLLHAQVLRNYQAGDIQVPFWLSVYNVNYGRAAMALNWRALWLGEGAITGVVEEVGGVRIRISFHLFQPHQADQMSGCHWTSQLHRLHLV